MSRDTTSSWYSLTPQHYYDVIIAAESPVRRRLTRLAATAARHVRRCRHTAISASFFAGNISVLRHKDGDHGADAAVRSSLGQLSSVAVDGTAVCAAGPRPSAEQGGWSAWRQSGLLDPVDTVPRRVDGSGQRLDDRGVGRTMSVDDVVAARRPVRWRRRRRRQ